jgi:drug/metabolite transporter (DMT)-like permease
MNLDRRSALAALAAAGLLWGTTVPVTKLALQWLPPGWLTVARFGLAAAVLLAAARFRVRGAASPAVLAWGAVGYGGSILVQNAGITRTSVSHAALLIGATPVLVAVIAALWHRSVAPPVAWTGFAVSFAGVGLVAAGGGGGASFAGDGLVLASLGFSASFTVAQARLLPGRDPVAVTAGQCLAAALTALPVAAVTEGTPPAAAAAGPVLATAGLVLLGTLAAATLFAYGQARVSAEIAGSFVNLEPLVGVAAGAAVFGDPVGIAQAAGTAAILTGIALGSLPLLRAGPRSPGQASMPYRLVTRRATSGRSPRPSRRRTPRPGSAGAATWPSWTARRPMARSPYQVRRNARTVSWTRPLGWLRTRWTHAARATGPVQSCGATGTP